MHLCLEYINHARKHQNPCLVLKAQLHGSGSSSSVYYVISPRARMPEFNFGETIARNGFVLVARAVC